MQMLQKLLNDTSPRRMLQYHNLFCCLDLLVHLKKLNLRATGTVRKNRMEESHDTDEKAPKGTSKVKYDQNNGMNFITVIDSKPVSILFTAAGVTPVSHVKCYTKDNKQKDAISFPNAFKVYNTFMGGVDLHDQHCNKLSIIQSKKWTWIIFMKLVQASITNATVLYDSATENEKKLGTKDFALKISEQYLRSSERKKYKNHSLEITILKRYCSREKCKNAQVL